MDIWVLLYALTFLFAIPRTKWHRKPQELDPTFSKRTVASADDCNVYWDGSKWVMSSLTTARMWTGYFSSTDCKNGGGMRFTNVTIPKDSIINSAVLRLTAAANRTADNVNSLIRGEDSDNPSAFSTLADYQARPRTSQSVNWDAIPDWTLDVEYTSPDFAAVVQAIVNRSGWASGNAMVIFWDDHDGRSSAVASCVRDPYSYDGSSTKAPLLEITYTLPVSAPTNCSVSVLSETSLRVSWTDASTDEDDFHVERKTGAGGTYAEIQVVTSTTKATTGTVYTWDNTGLSLYCSDTYNYYYRVRAHRHSDNVYSNYSNEAANVSCFQSLQDSGVGVDTPYLEGQVPVQDVGVGEDIATVAIGVEYKDVFDSGSGVDTPTVESQIPAADSGVGVDTPFIETQIPVTDLGLGTDIIQSIEVPVQDSGLGVDEVTSIEIPVSDSGLGTDVPSIETSIPVSDSGIGVDTPTIEGQVSVLDSGIGVDTIPSIGILVSDAGLGVDVPSIQSQVQVTDLGSGVEVVSVEGQIVVVDLGVGVDVPSLLGQIPVSDLGVGVDVVKAETEKAVADSGIGVDSVWLVRKPIQRLLSPVRVIPPERILPPVR